MDNPLTLSIFERLNELIGEYLVEYRATDRQRLALAQALMLQATAEVAAMSEVGSLERFTEEHHLAWYLLHDRGLQERARALSANRSLHGDHG